jgi:hypothetical protein
VRSDRLHRRARDRHALADEGSLERARHAVHFDGSREWTAVCSLRSRRPQGDKEKRMAARKKGRRRYGKTASKKVERAMHEMKRGQLRSGRSGKRVTSRKQAIAIGLSEARRRGAKVPGRGSRSRSRSSSSSRSRSR